MSSGGADSDPVAPPRRAAEICAIVVAYHPGPEVPGHLAAIQKQVAHLIVVDNEASVASHALLAPFASQPAVEILSNPDNRGIATALNQGVARAAAAGFEWVATFDQDSLVPDGYFAGLLAAWAGHPGRERVAILAPLYRDRHLGFVFSPGGPVTAAAPPVQPVSVTATSGNLVSVAALRAVGGFREDFFIDCVDFEFCLRCRRAGWSVLEVRSVLLEHAAGRWQQRPWLWKNPRFNDYDATRRYYQARNRLIVYARLGSVDPRWTLRDAWGYACDGAKLLLFCTGRRKKLSAMLTGGWHAVTGRRGRWQPATG